VFFRLIFKLYSLDGSGDSSTFYSIFLLLLRSVTREVEDFCYSWHELQGMVMFLFLFQKEILL